MNTRFFPKPTLRILAAILGLLLPACTLVERAGMAVLYRKAALPDPQSVKNLAYGPEAGQQLNLFLPAPETQSGWPIVLFVHGGSWVSGDRDLTVGGADVYGNIGRYLASQGIGTAVISYRLQPQATWQEQVTDVARAAGWIHRHVVARGGDPDRIFFMGHSAGAQLAAFTALNGPALQQAGVPAHAVRGVIAVSGAGMDLGDALTYALGHDPAYYRSLVDPKGQNPQWARDASVTSFLRKTSPPFLILYGASEEKPMIRQSVRLHEALDGQGVFSKILAIPCQGHSLMVLALSRPDKMAGPATVDFIRRFSPPAGRQPASY
jgi:acetyl esterase/lipase